jgi:putative membrane protein
LCYHYTTDAGSKVSARVRPDPYSWTAHPEALAAVALLVGSYVYALRASPAPRWRIACFATAVALLVATAVTPLDALSFHVLTAHLLQNVVLSEWAPLLVVLGLPPALAAVLARHALARFLTRPAVALPVWLTTTFVWHVPALYDAALEHPATLLHLEHALYFATGCLLWWPVLQEEPWRLRPISRAGYLFAAFVLASPLGLLLALLPEPVYGYYEDGPGLWGLSPLTDQQIAGITMASEQALVFFVVLTWLFFRFLGEEERKGYEPAR